MSPRNVEAIVHCSVRTVLLGVAVLGCWLTNEGMFNTMSLGYITFYILWEMFVFSFLLYEVATAWCFTRLAKFRDPKRPTTKEMKWQTLLKKHKRNILKNYSGYDDDWLEGFESVEWLAAASLCVVLLQRGFVDLGFAHAIACTSILLMRMLIRSTLKKYQENPMQTCPDGESFDALCNKLFNTRMREQ